MTEYQDWLEKGYHMGWLGQAFCHTHDSVPLTQAEGEALDAIGWDTDQLCVVVARLHDPMDRLLADA